MATIAFTPHLKQFFDLPDQARVEGGTMADIVRALDERWPGLGFYITDEQGRLRKHVAVWVDGRRIEDREALSDTVPPDAEVHILQALSGG